MAKKADEFKEVKRVFKSGRDITHDLFKLEVGKMIVNNGWDVNDPIIQQVEHCHFFHTVDSNGKLLDRCASIGGHFHYIKMKEVDGEFIVECSTPKKEVTKVIRRGRNYSSKKEITDVSIGEHMDKHTHTATYIASEILKPRKINAESIKAIDAIDAAKKDLLKNEKNS